MKPTSLHYEHAPITEAVIALQSVGPKNPSKEAMSNFATFQEQVKGEYPKRAEKFALQAQFQFDIQQQSMPRSVASSGHQLIGYTFTTESGKSIVQVEATEFAFSQLAPYDCWETFRGEARRLWEIYRLTFLPQHITRVGVRFVNRIDIPTEGKQGIDLDQYFRTAPRLAPELPQELSTYFMRLQMEIVEVIGGVLVITETPVPSPSPGYVSSILDIDTFIQNSQFDDEQAWMRIDELRHQKNFAFEACITDRVRELIK